MALITAYAGFVLIPMSGLCKQGVKHLAAAILSLAACSSVSAETIATSEITGEALGQLRGVVGVNQAAGDMNLQSNSRAIAVSSGDGVAIANTIDRQQPGSNQAAMPEVAVTRIGENALAGAHGLIGINQVIGVQNAQLNAFALATSSNGGLSDAALAATLAEPTVATESTDFVNTSRQVHVDNTALSGATGVVQLNQTAGTGNISSNRIEMSMNPIH